jgi:hypothetical protein
MPRQIRMPYTPVVHANEKARPAMASSRSAPADGGPAGMGALKTTRQTESTEVSNHERAAVATARAAGPFGGRLPLSRGTF